ncbi:MAG: class I SAM-dependent methyltransferase [Candidatus Promineifilaceae bacterium]
MFYRSQNSRPHNWLIHHYCTKSISEKRHYLRGRLLDIGCGQKPYQEILSDSAESYIGLDYTNTLHGFEQVDVMGQGLQLPFPAESFDSVVCFQVLEHVPTPQQLMNEIFRVLKSDGHAFIATPFMWGEHEQPHDYFRYTRYGLAHLAQTAGFEIVSITPDTGYWSTAVLRLNYSLARLFRGPLRYALAPLQAVGWLLDQIDRSYTVDTATFSTLLRKSAAMDK